MTFPQPMISDQIAAATKQWRLLTPALSAGDIYELDGSFTSIAIGPESDFASIQVTYLDTSLKPTLVGSVRLTPLQPFNGSLAPRVDTSYPISPGRKGRMTASLLDNYNTGYHPKGFAINTDAIITVVPTIDLIGWQGAPPSLPIRRADKNYAFQNHPANSNANGTLWRIVPTYGRKYTTISMYNNSGNAVTWEARGVLYSTVSNFNPSAPTTQDDYEQQLIVSAPIASGSAANRVVTASADGIFDAIAINLKTAAGGTISNCLLRVQSSYLIT